MEIVYIALVYIFIFLSGFFWKRTIREISNWIKFLKRLHQNGWSFSRLEESLEKEKEELMRNEKKLIESIIENSLKEFPNVKIIPVEEWDDLIDSEEELKKEEDGGDDDK